MEQRVMMFVETTEKVDWEIQQRRIVPLQVGNGDSSTFFGKSKGNRLLKTLLLVSMLFLAGCGSKEVAEPPQQVSSPTASTTQITQEATATPEPIVQEEEAAKETVTVTILDRLAGRWGWTMPGFDCDSLPTDHIFDAENNLLRLQSDQPIPMHDGTTREYVDYRILDRDNDTITLAMENETRLNKNGDLAVWKILMVDEETFYWEIDGQPEERWGPVVRCSGV